MDGGLWIGGSYGAQLKLKLRRRNLCGTGEELNELNVLVCNKIKNYKIAGWEGR